MPEQIRPIRCHLWRASDGACMEPAAYEVVGPYPTLLCAQHARERAAESLDERWDQFGPEPYYDWCLAAVDELRDLEYRTENLVTREILEEARNYLKVYELQRAREAFRKARS